jgi:hypothetical protein
MCKVLCGVLVAGLGLACSDSTGVLDVAGNYTLVSVSGMLLPATVLEVDANNKVEILAGEATLTGNSTYSASITARITENGAAATETQTDTGTWTLNGSEITLQSDEAGEDPLTATVSSNRITLTTDLEGFPVTLVFQR